MLIRSSQKCFHCQTLHCFSLISRIRKYLSIALQLKMLVGPQHIDIRLRERLHLFKQADDRCSENRDNQAWIVTDFLYL